MESIEQNMKILFSKLNIKCPQKSMENILLSKPLTHDQLLHVEGISKSFAIKHGTAIIQFFEDEYHQCLFYKLQQIRRRVAHEFLTSPYFLVETKFLRKIASDMSFQNVPSNPNYKYFEEEVSSAREKLFATRYQNKFS